VALAPRPHVSVFDVVCQQLSPARAMRQGGSTAAQRGPARRSSFCGRGDASPLSLVWVFSLPLLFLPGAAATSAAPQQGNRWVPVAVGSRPRLQLRDRAASVGTQGVATGGLLRLKSKVKRLSNSTLSGDALQEEVLKRVAQEQVSLLNRLSQLDGELRHMLETAKVDLHLASESDTALTNITERTDAATLESKETVDRINATNMTQQEINKRTVKTEVIEAAMRAQIADALDKEAQAASAASVMQQVDENRRTLQRLGPRLLKLNSRLNSIEARLQHNNISEVVEDASKRAMMDVLRDMNRGLYRQLPG